jgi:DNA-binding NtrC family response regulator
MTSQAFANGPYPAFVGLTVAHVERQLILGTLDHVHGNRTHAARILGISIRTLRNKLHEYSQAGLRVPEPGRIRESLPPSPGTASV